ncbi:hypothetical protein TRFO_23361 [Tritrichomonas foetus]|uniref:Sel1 repeat family protein n=1 Tax=Tritrichomonas foetus TaxID=1144522 RepID=A0A1J4K9V0_9EUKA|nr:hypothetical protein TRFO_23361 [Tritrichomonas foetus]|eukprot:OHT08207.1 hypothetical protein TRFO_23361 [Tritrichomonas foetus]
MLSVIKNDDDELEEQYKIERKSHQKAELEEKKKLADEGDGEAMLWLVEKYKKEPLRRIRIESYYYMKKLAKIGDIPSMRYLAFSYKNARDVDIDMKEYLTYTKMLADEGEIDAMLKTAECYRDGIGCDQDPETSKRYYNKAFKATTQNLIAQIKEDKNNTDGLYKFSNQLLNGDVYEKNFDYGFKLLQTAASYGNQDAISDIINYFLRSGLVDTTEEEITKFLKLKKDPEYVFDLANQFLSGKLKIVGKSKVKEFDPNGPIVSFFKETAVEEEHYKLLMKFALCYREGKHQFLPKDTKEAARLFRIIIDKLPENHEAVSRLVSMYENNEIDDVNENEKEQLIKLNKKLELVHLKERADAGTSNCGFAMVNYANALIKNNIDVEEAFKYLKGAAINHKITIAMLELGEIFERGEIVEKNLEESLFYYGLGEQSKDSACALNYTKLLLCENRGDEAVEVIKNFGGERFVDKLFNKMRYEWRFSPEQNVQMLKQAADAGDVSCMKILAQYLFDGRNVAHNHQEAKKYEEMAKQYE